MLGKSPNCFGLQTYTNSIGDCFKKKKFAYDAEHVHVCNYVRLKSCLLEKSVTAVQISLIGLGVELISMLNS